MNDHLHLREQRLAVAASCDASLHGLACRPVLTVGDVPEVRGVSRVEAWLLTRLGWEQPHAFDPRQRRRLRLEPVHHHVVGVEAEQDVGEQLEVVHLAQLRPFESRERNPQALSVERHRLASGNSSIEPPITTPSGSQS